MSTISELQNQIQDLDRQIKNLSDGIPLDGDRIEKYLSEFTQRTNALLTIAALMSGLAAVQVMYLKTFLVAVFPLFVFAIAFYLLSSKRLNIMSATWTSELNVMLRESYKFARKWHLLTDVSLTGFFASFTIHLYLFVFGGGVNIRDICFVYAIALILGLARYLYINAGIQTRASRNALAPVPSTPDQRLFMAGSAPPSPFLEMEK